MSRIEIIDTTEPNGQELLGVSLVQPHLFLPTHDAGPIYAGHLDWRDYTVDRAARGEVFGLIMATGGRKQVPLASSVVKPHKDPRYVEFKNLWVSAEFGNVGAGEFLGKFTLSQVRYIYPDREWVIGDTKLGSPMHSFAVEKLGFEVVKITLLNQGKFGHNGQPDVILRRRIPRNSTTPQYF